MVDSVDAESELGDAGSAPIVPRRHWLTGCHRIQPSESLRYAIIDGPDGGRPSESQPLGSNRVSHALWVVGIAGTVICFADRAVGGERPRLITY
jgi:hypothetical protein